MYKPRQMKASSETSFKIKSIDLRQSSLMGLLPHPYSGLLVIFPGASPHRVQDYDCARFAIARNLKFSW